MIPTPSRAARLIAYSALRLFLSFSLLVLHPKGGALPDGPDFDAMFRG